jgi:hypothetical protein
MCMYGTDVARLRIEWHAPPPGAVPLGLGPPKSVMPPKYVIFHMSFFTCLIVTPCFVLFLYSVYTPQAPRKRQPELNLRCLSY